MVSSRCPLEFSGRLMTCGYWKDSPNNTKIKLWVEFSPSQPDGKPLTPRKYLYLGNDINARMTLSDLDFSTVPQTIADTFMGNKVTEHNFKLAAEPIWLDHVSRIGDHEAKAVENDPELDHALFKKPLYAWDHEKLRTKLPKNSTRISNRKKKAIYAKFKNTKEELTALELTDLRFMEARRHPTKWMPAPELLLKARTHGAKHRCDPFDYPPYRTWKKPIDHSSDLSDRVPSKQAASIKVKKSSKAKPMEKASSTSKVPTTAKITKVPWGGKASKAPSKSHWENLQQYMDLVKFMMLDSD